jgi:hypothetical protein
MTLTNSRADERDDAVTAKCSISIEFRFFAPIRRDAADTHTDTDTSAVLRGHTTKVAVRDEQPASE